MTTRAQVPVPAGAGVTNEEAGDVSAAELLQRMQATARVVSSNRSTG